MIVRSPQAAQWLRRVRGGKTLTGTPFDPDIRAVWRTVLHDVSVHPVLEVYGATGRAVFVLTVLKKERSI